MRFFYVLILFFILTGCGIKKDIFHIFYGQLNDSLSFSDKNEIKNSVNVDSLIYLVRTKHFEVVKTVYKPLSNDLNSILLDSFKIESAYLRESVLLVAYQRSLQKRTVNFREIANEIRQYRNDVEIRIKLKRIQNESRLSHLSKNNYEKFSPGDTINLLLPLEIVGKYKDFIYQDVSIDSSFSDTLFLKCLLTKKNTEVEDSTTMANEHFFWLKILTAKNSDIGSVNPKFGQGKILKFQLINYARDIPK